MVRKLPVYSQQTHSRLFFFFLSQSTIDTHLEEHNENILVSTGNAVMIEPTYYFDIFLDESLLDEILLCTNENLIRKSDMSNCPVIEPIELDKFILILLIVGINKKKTKYRDYFSTDI